MTPDGTHGRISDLILERYLLGELDPGTRETVRRKLDEDASLRERLETLRRSDQEVLEHYPVAWMGELVRRRLREHESPVLAAGRRSSNRRRLVPALSLAAVALLAVALLPPIRSFWSGRPERSAPSLAVRIKGLEPQLLIFRKTAAGSERLADGATAREGDLILIRYEAAGRPYGAILSIDGRGTVTRHLPIDGPEAVRLSSDGSVPLAFAYELDDAPRWERFYFVTADSPFRLEPILRAARAIGPPAAAAGVDSLRLPESYGQSIFTLKKEVEHE